MSLSFTVAYFKRSPQRYRFFVVGEIVWFGDEEQVRRFNADPDYAETHELRAKELIGCDFENAATAQWVADRLNEATHRRPMLLKLSRQEINMKISRALMGNRNAARKRR